MDNEMHYVPLEEFGKKTVLRKVAEIFYYTLIVAFLLVLAGGFIPRT